MKSLPWHSVQRMFAARYGQPDEASLSFDNLMTVSQGNGTVACYRDAFSKVAKRAGCDLNDRFVLAIFRRNLAPDVKSLVDSALIARGTDVNDFNAIAGVAVTVDADVRSQKRNREGGGRDRSSGGRGRGGRGRGGGSGGRGNRSGAPGVADKDKPCFTKQNTGKCDFGDRCRYSHDPSVLAAKQSGNSK